MSEAVDPCDELPARNSVIDFNAFRDGVFERVQNGDAFESAEALPRHIYARDAVAVAIEIGRAHV